MEELIDKYFAKLITLKEKEILFKALEEDEVLKKEFLQLQNVMALSGMVENVGDENVSRKAKQHFIQLIFRRRLKHTLVSSMKYAAMFALLITITFFVTKRYLLKDFGNNQTTITASKGQRVKVNLPDGTIAWLSPCSKIRFSASFNEADRNIELEGATFFDVAKNEKKPFVVSVKDYKVRVLGTKFNISAYASSVDFEIDLVEGMVHIYDVMNVQNELFLQPKEKAVLQAGKLVKEPSDFDNEEYLKSGVVSFLSEPFSRVLNSISQWNDVKFSVKSYIDMNKRISGKFRQSDSVESLLTALQHIASFKYRMISDDEIEIY